MTNEEAIHYLKLLSRVRSDGYYEYLSNGGKEDADFNKEMEAFDMAIASLGKENVE